MSRASLITTFLDHVDRGLAAQQRDVAFRVQHLRHFVADEKDAIDRGNTAVFAQSTVHGLEFGVLVTTPLAALVQLDRIAAGENCCIPVEVRDAARELFRTLALDCDWSRFPNELRDLYAGRDGYGSHPCLPREQWLAARRAVPLEQWLAVISTDRWTKEADYWECVSDTLRELRAQSLQSQPCAEGANERREAPRG